MMIDDFTGVSGEDRVGWLCICNLCTVYECVQ